MLRLRPVELARALDRRGAHPVLGGELVGGFCRGLTLIPLRHMLVCAYAALQFLRPVVPAPEQPRAAVAVAVEAEPLMAEIRAAAKERQLASLKQGAATPVTYTNRT